MAREQEDERGEVRTNLHRLGIERVVPAEDVSIYGAEVLQVEKRVRVRAYTSSDSRLTAPCWYESCRPSAVIWGSWQLCRASMTYARCRR